MVFKMKRKMVCVISFGVFLWLLAAAVADKKDVVTFNIDKRGITADEINKRKINEGRSDQDLKDSGKRDYYYLPSSASNYGRPHFSSSGYDSTGPSGPSFDSNYPSNDYPQQHYRPSYDHYDHGLTPQYPPTAGHHTTTITKPINTFALKSILIPIAGLAILGAAAALSSNPVLLQLGVVKGRKRRSLVDEKKFLEKRNGKRF